MTLDLSKPIMTRDGRKAVHVNSNDISKNMLFAVQDGNGGWTFLTTFSDGGAGSSGQYNDIINTPVKHKLTGCLNVYLVAGQLIRHDGTVHPDDKADAQRIACIDLSQYEITFEEGSGL